MSRVVSRQTPGGVCVVNRDDFVKSFRDVPKISITSLADVRQKIDGAIQILSKSQEDWTKRMNQLKLIRSIAIHGANIIEKEQLLSQLIRLTDCLELSVKDLRSQILREAAITCSFLFETYGSEVHQIADRCLPAAFAQSAVSTKVMATCGSTLTMFIVQRALLHFLRTMNEIRSVLNDRPTVSICLSRVVSCEDFVIAAQNVIAKIVSDPIPVQQPGQATLEFALELCRFHLQSMSKIFMSATLNGNSFLSGNKYVCKAVTHSPWSRNIQFRPNSMSAATSTVYGFRKNANALYRKSSSVPQPPQQEAPRFEQQNLNYSFLELIDETPPGYPKDSDKYQRIMRWITNITTETSDDVTSSETAKLQEEGGQNEIIEEENGEFVSVLSATGTRSENGEI
uniref:CLASP N-terminal domain-containing protein n=1 Tax=Caenorhabditis japonica TaxID=281687 RepID=A0A8R1I3Y2_CAEJA